MPARGRALLPLAAAGAIACGAAPERPAATSDDAHATAEAPTATASLSSATAIATTKPPDPPAPRAPFAPPACTAPQEKTRADGDCAWTPIATGDDPPLLFKARVHPNAIKRSVYVEVVAIDAARVGLGAMGGTLEPNAAAPEAARAGLVPTARLDALVAVFNGGFMERHGHYGMRVDGVTLAPPRDDACTIAVLDDGRVVVGEWSTLDAGARGAPTLRQAPPCLVERGVVHPDIDSEVRPRKWSASVDGQLDVRRSALGADRTGATLLFGLGEFTTPHDLADAMRAAGAVVAAQLDINWSYTRFLVYGVDHAKHVVKETLVPKLKYAPNAYVDKPAERDFFFLYRR
jgi:hypothetical protein